MSLHAFTRVFILIVLVAIACTAFAAGPVHVLGKEPVVLELRDVLRHPLFQWPRTLLSYPFTFEDVDPAQVSLIDLETKQTVPFQITEAKLQGGKLRSGVLNFFSDLPTGARRRFALSAVDAPAPKLPALSARPDGNSIILDSGAVKVRIPATQPVGKDTIPGPVMAMNRSKRWVGQSRLVCAGRKPVRIETTTVESGPLLTAWRVRYIWNDGVSYQATIRCVSGQDWIGLKEEMSGLKDGEAYVESTWTGFSPTHRHAANHPYQSSKPDKRGLERWDWERIDQTDAATHINMDSAMSADGEFNFRLALYSCAAYVRSNYAGFWDDKGGDALGIFIDDALGWQDHEYSIWNSSPALDVRFFWRNKQLYWRWELANGSRSTCMAFYDHSKDVERANAYETILDGVKDDAGQTFRPRPFPVNYLQYLKSYYSALCLNNVKDWQLTYPLNDRRAPAVFGTSNSAAAGKAITQNIRSVSLMNEMMNPGLRWLSSGFNATATRGMYTSWAPTFSRTEQAMTPDDREQAVAALLLMGYVGADEYFMPMQRMLGGHPNFMADAKAMPAHVAFLFPDHPMAREWADMFERSVDLNTRYHTRPDVADWDAHGGRWTENLGTYVWAFLKPTIKSNYLLSRHFDGRNRMANPQLAQIGDWLVGALTAPFNGETPEHLAKWRDSHSWGMVDPAKGPRRIHPPQGAHAERRQPPAAMWQLGRNLMQYAPLTAEHLMWAARPTDDDMEEYRGPNDVWNIMLPAQDNLGTPPRLTSAKYTGYGIVMRAGVNTPRELSLHIQQIDPTHNYRWGWPGEGNNGGLYLYAGGKGYSHNGREDVGDRFCHDTDFSCNFGVWKDNTFKCVGQNVLDRPFYDLETAQLAELTARSGAGAYSWPEYQGRSVMLVGDEYLLTYDRVHNPAITWRWSWNTHINDDMPFIQFLRKGGIAENSGRMEIKTDTTRGIYQDGTGDCLALVSPYTTLKTTATPYGCRVVTDTGTDYVLFTRDAQRFEDKDVLLDGSAGVIRRHADGQTELALFHAKRLATGGIAVAISNPNLGISLHFRDAADISGFSQGPNGGTLRLELPAAPAVTAAFYLDGAKLATKIDGNAVIVELPAGRHMVQWTTRRPTPLAPAILRTENGDGGGKVFFSAVPGAEQYRVELSKDNCRQWETVATTTDTTAEVTGLTNGAKVHLRVTAVNADAQSLPGVAYPLYVTNQPPLPPDGLRTRLGDGVVDLSWGQVLGVTAYRLWCRQAGQEQWEQIWIGQGQSFRHKRPGVIKAFADPGPQPANAKLPAYTVYEYAVSAVNRNGEGEKCRPVNTDPSSWLNWDPVPGEGFRRRSNRSELGELSPLYYPGSPNIFKELDIPSFTAGKLKLDGNVGIWPHQ